jgi:hypothetical protein
MLSPVVILAQTWPTPTPLGSGSDGVALNFGSDVDKTIAGSMVQGYNTINQGGAVDLLWIAIILAIVIISVPVVISRVRSL